VTFDNIDSLIGQELGVSEWLTIDQSRIQAFADITLDQQWIHTDPLRAAAESPFGGTIAHGFLTLSLISHFQFQSAVFPTDVSSIINYGSDRIRYITPVKAGQRIQGRSMLINVDQRSPQQKLIKTSMTVNIENEAKPALIAEILSLLVK
jgi:acyl dehydratase